MNKILITIYVPSIHKSFDTYITRESLIGDLKVLISSAIEKLSLGRFIANSHNILVDGVTGEELNNQLLVSETNIENGKKIILI